LNRPKTTRNFLSLLLLLSGVWTAPGAGIGQTLPPQPHRDGSGDITMALVGDIIVNQRLSAFSEPEFLAVRDLIRGATVAFGNQENLYHEYGEDIIPQAQSGGAWQAAHPRIARELAWMGFDIVSLANNHTMDYGEGGLRATMRALEDAGIAHAGAGENLGLARAPAYVETPGGRVALVAVASTFAEHMRAGHQTREHRGRPGLSPLRYHTVRTVPRRHFEALRELHAEGVLPGREEGDHLTVLGATFRSGAEQRVVTTPHPEDLEEVLEQVRAARRQANWVIVSSHTHEREGDDRHRPPGFYMEFARAAIDAGADVVVTHGPHVLRGIEIYRGRPIFYSLADFVFQSATLGFQPADAYPTWGLDPFQATAADYHDARRDLRDGGWEADPVFWQSVLAVPEFRGGALSEVRLYPLTGGYGLERPQQGRYLLARGELGREILEHLRELSEPFGTRIEIEDGVGVIRASGAAEDPSQGGSEHRDRRRTRR
jgi:poly-gamma-glutamate capsule biosynthesis protein CapA/YwtB (metallophosphatase superfamily)